MDVFDIRLLGFDGAPGGDPVADLSRVFGIDAHRAEAIVRRAPILVKRGVDEETAERFFNHLRGIGAEVSIERRVVPSMPPGPRASAAPSGAPSATPTPRNSPPPKPTSIELAPAPGPLPDLDGVGFEPYYQSSPPGALGAGGDPFDDPLATGPESLPVPDFDAVGADPARYDSIRPGAVGSGPPPSVQPAPPGGPAASPGGQSSSLRHRSREPLAVQREHEGEELRPFVPRLFGAFVYPFQKSGLAVLAGVAIVAAILSIIPFIGAILAAGVQAIFFFRVIQHTGDGEDDFPQPTDFVDLYDLIVPSIRFLLAMAVPFVPAILAVYLLGLDSPLVIPATAALVLLGLAYMPASVMVASLTSGCLGPLNPVAGIMMMTRVPGPYVVTTFCVGTVVAVNGVFMTFLYGVTNLIPLPFVPSLIQQTAGLLMPTIACRMLGIFLHQHRHELGLGLD